MPATPTIQVDQLLEALRRVLDEVADRHGTEIAFTDDYYWALPTARAFDPFTPPGDFTMGQLSDDVESVREFLARPTDEFIAIWHELAHITGVLRAIEHLDRPTRS